MVYRFLDQKSSGNGVAAIEPNYQLANERIDRLLENLRNEKFIHCLGTIFRVLISLICNH